MCAGPLSAVTDYKEPRPFARLASLLRKRSARKWQRVSVPYALVISQLWRALRRGPGVYTKQKKVSDVRREQKSIVATVDSLSIYTGFRKWTALAWPWGGDCDRVGVQQGRWTRKMLTFFRSIGCHEEKQSGIYWLKISVNLYWLNL